MKRKGLLLAGVLVLLLSGTAWAGSITITFDLAHDVVYQFYASSTINFSYGTTAFYTPGPGGMEPGPQFEQDHGVIATLNVPALGFPPSNQTYVQPVTATIQVPEGRCLHYVKFSVSDGRGGAYTMIGCVTGGSHTFTLTKPQVMSPVVGVWQ
ncbi:MAG: hypothetical protein AB1921_05495 [Thermodesulfobacteriota bacterium]